MRHGEAAAERLTRAVEELIAVAPSFVPTLYVAPADEEWSPMQNLAHVAEFVPFWAERARHFALGGETFGRTPEEWEQRAAAVADHAHDTLEAVLADLRAGLTRAVSALREIPDDAWTRGGAHEPGGPIQTVGELIQQRLLGHVESHLRQATEAAAHR